MKRKRKLKYVSIILLLSLICILFSSCEVAFPAYKPSDEEIKDEIYEEPVAWGEKNHNFSGLETITLVKGERLAIYDMLPEAMKGGEVVWSSECDGVVTVSTLGELYAVDYGRTAVYAEVDEAKVGYLVTVELLISNNNGYKFNLSNEERSYKVNNTAEADRLVDMAIAEHAKELTIDFSSLGSDFSPMDDYDYHYEFSNHASFRFSVRSNKPQVLKIQIRYNENAASESIAPTDANKYLAIPSGNMIARNYYASLEYTPRPDDYENFAINGSTKGKMPVTNSEELWWCLEQGYVPTFPKSNTKAELIYEYAKMILRDIIYDGMTDTQKALAIYEYLIYAVAYDYDAFNAGSTKEQNNVCYYLEGVFEYGRAVCDGKSKAYVLLCAMEGIECLRDYGSALDGGAGHAWNYVKLDGIWYLVDTTLGDIALALIETEGTMPDFYGSNIELVGYNGFGLSPLYYKDTYEYTGIWDSIVKGSENNIINGFPYAVEISEDGIDFVLEGGEELSKILQAISNSVENTDYAVMFRLENSFLTPYSVIRHALVLVGIDLEFEVYTVGNEDFVVVFKNSAKS